MISTYAEVCIYVHTTIWMHHIDSNKTHREKSWWELCKNAAGCLELILEAVEPPAYLIRQTIHLGATAWETWRNSVIFSDRLQHMDIPLLVVQQRLIAALCRHKMQPKSLAKSVKESVRIYTDNGYKHDSECFSFPAFKSLTNDNLKYVDMTA